MLALELAWRPPLTDLSQRLKKALSVRYRIERELGRGGMAIVFLAEDLKHRRQVAIKVLSPEVTSAAGPERFVREIETVARLTHPHILPLFDSGQADGLLFYAMPYVEGESLRDRLTREKQLPLEDALQIAREVADALSYAHSRGVIHRDIKPGNILLESGHAVVADFGIARAVAAAGGEKLTATGIAVGTPAYMSPEQAAGSRDLDGRSDLYSLGCVLYEMLAGQPPYTGPTAESVVFQHLNAVPPRVTAIRPAVPAAVAAALQRTLAKTPADRFNPVGQFAEALKQAVESGAPARPSPQGVASIAVLPFVNRSRDEADEYFCDGLADELLNVLAKMRRLKVAARTSSFHFKGRNPTIAEVGSALNVATLLEGSVRKAGNRVRISVQLVKVSDGYHLWSETYDRTLDDIFAVQDDIASSVVRELRTTLLGEDGDPKTSGDVKAELATAAKGRGRNVEAHRLYLQARYFLERRTREDVAKGIAYLEESLALDPGNALAWAELGGAYSTETELPEAEGYKRAREAVGRALALEPDLPEGHAQLAGIQMFHAWDWRGAEASTRRALQLAPGNALVLRRAGMLAVIQGRLDEGLALAGRSVEQDPLSASAYSHYGMALHAANRLEEAEQACRKALELAPERMGTHASLTTFLLAQGRIEEAQAEAMREPSEAARLWALAIIHLAAGRQAESEEALRALCGKHADDSAYLIAEVYAARREVDAAFEWLERAYAQREPGLVDMKAIPRYRALVGDPRWGVFLRKMGLEE